MVGPGLVGFQYAIAIVTGADDFADFKNAVAIINRGQGDIALPFEIVGQHNIGQRQLAIIVDRYGVKDGFADNIRAVASDGSVFRDRHTGVGIFVADWINVDRRANGGIISNRDRFIIAGGLGRPFGQHFVDEIGFANLHAVKGILAVRIGRGGLEQLVASIEDTIIVGVLIEVDGHAADGPFARVFHAEIGIVLELFTPQDDRFLGPPFLECGIGVIIIFIAVFPVCIGNRVCKTKGTVEVQIYVCGGLTRRNNDRFHRNQHGKIGPSATG